MRAAPDSLEIMNLSGSMHVMVMYRAGGIKQLHALVNAARISPVTLQ
jgi:hypothetical protein